MLADQPETPADAQALAHFGQNDFDIDTTMQYRNRFASRAAEIAVLVERRDAEKLQSRCLTAVVKEGTLVLRHPDIRNRPDQAYRTVAGNPL